MFFIRFAMIVVMANTPKKLFMVGIDEVGRGPLAGPVAVCALAATTLVLKKFKTIKESKQLTPQAREMWYRIIVDDQRVQFAVSFVGAKAIDEKGIVPSIRFALENSLRKLRVAPETCSVLLDGGLKAPPNYKKQKTIIRGDEKEVVIAMASVVAKVTRDRLMVRLSKKFPKYGFEKHKGYGTKKHVLAIKKYGCSIEHRKSFCKGLL